MQTTLTDRGWSGDARVPVGGAGAPPALVAIDDECTMVKRAADSDALEYAVWTSRSWTLPRRIPHQAARGRPAAIRVPGDEALLHVAYIDGDGILWHTRAYRPEPDDDEGTE